MCTTQLAQDSQAGKSILKRRETNVSHSNNWMKNKKIQVKSRSHVTFSDK